MATTFTPDATQTILPKKPKALTDAAAAGSQALGPAPVANTGLDTGVPAPVQAATDNVQAPQHGGVETVAAPAVPVPVASAAPPPAGGVTVESGVQQLNQQAIARIGRPLNNQEIQGLAQQVGPPAGPNGTYSAQQLEMAQGLVGRYSGNINDPYGALPETAPGSPSSLANTRLTELLGLNFNEVDPNSQAIQQPLGAFRAAQSRATDRQRMIQAQRNQAGGVSQTSGGADAQLQSMLESQGLNEASYEANLYAQELGTQREALQNAIQLATQAGLQNKARELQEKLGQLDIELRRQLGQGQLALGARSLNQNDQQFLESMGFNYAQLQAQMNNNAIQAMLNGL